MLAMTLELVGMSGFGLVLRFLWPGVCLLMWEWSLRWAKAWVLLRMLGFELEVTLERLWVSWSELGSSSG